MDSESESESAVNANTGKRLREQSDEEFLQIAMKLEKGTNKWRQQQQEEIRERSHRFKSSLGVY